ncbi:MAG: DNA repair protein RecO [Candidatus Latescibacteria bacterium]|nr:DNA repair protein RecO [Candidatus Latescibacterota bacterium]
MKMAICKTEAVVLRSIKWSETSRIVTLYTLGFGKLKVVAKGARRPKSQFGASLEPITHCAVVFYRKEGRDLHTLSQSDLIAAFPKLKSDLSAITYASAVCELTDRLMAGEEPNPPLFRALVETLGGIEESAAADAEKFLWRFQLHLAAFLGYRPEFGNCVRCSAALEGARVAFSLTLGGTLCDRCADEGVERHLIHMGTARFLSHLERARPDRVRSLKSLPQLAEEIRPLLGKFLATHTEDHRGLRSLDFLEQVKKVG